MLPKNTFTVGPPTISYVESDAVLLCCEASHPIGGFVAAQFIIKNADFSQSVVMRWGLATFANGRFVLQAYQECPWCKRQLPAITVTTPRLSVN